MVLGYVGLILQTQSRKHFLGVLLPDEADGHRKDKNNRPLKDGERFQIAVGNIVGKRLTYREVTGKNLEDGLCPN